MIKIYLFLKNRLKKNCIIPALLLAFASCRLAAQKSEGLGHPFDTLQYDRVVAYDFEGNGDNNIVNDGRLFHRIHKQQVLSGDQVRYVHQLLQDPKTYGNNTAACFEPHLGFVWYRQGRIVAYVSACMDCNYLESSFPIPATSARQYEYASKEFLPLKGFSKKGRQSLNVLLTQWDFPHVVSLNTSWDK